MVELETIIKRRKLC